MKIANFKALSLKLVGFLQLGLLFNGNEPGSLKSKSFPATFLACIS